MMRLTFILLKTAVTKHSRKFNQNKKLLRAPLKSAQLICGLISSVLSALVPQVHCQLFNV